MGKIGILQAGHHLLRSPAAAVPPRLFNSNALIDLIDLMKATMRDTPGVGLAAPQAGVPLQVIVRIQRRRCGSSRPQRGKSAGEARYHSRHGSTLQ
jgi:peptide deformylase